MCLIVFDFFAEDHIMKLIRSWLPCLLSSIPTMEIYIKCICKNLPSNLKSWRHVNYIALLRLNLLKTKTVIFINYTHGFGSTQDKNVKQTNHVPQIHIKLTDCMTNDD